MPVEVIMPKVDMDMASGKVMTWHVAEGENVEKGAPLFDIESDKAAMEVEAADSGILRHRVPEGTEVPIGAPVARLYSEDEEPGTPPVVADRTSWAKADSSQNPALADGPPEDTGAVTQDAPPSSGKKSRATPLARSLARDTGGDLADLPGSIPLPLAHPTPPHLGWSGRNGQRSDHHLL